MEVDAQIYCQILQLSGLYGHIIDAEQWSRFDELWTQDAKFDLRGMDGPCCNGLAEIRQFFSSQSHPAAHHASNLVITSISQALDSVETKSKYFVPVGAGLFASGDYVDRIVRTSRGWRFAERVATSRFPSRRTGLRGETRHTHVGDTSRTAAVTPEEST